MYADEAEGWRDDVDNLDGEFLDDADTLDDEIADLSQGLRQVLHPAYAEADAEAVEEMLIGILDALPAAEGFNFGNALSQIGQGAQRVLSDPTVRQIAGTALPIAGAAAGTFIGGPVGTAIGGQLGGMAAQALGGAGARPPRPGAALVPPAAVPGAAVPTPAPQQGSAAAAQLLQLTQNPDVLKSLASLALGAMGRSSIPVGSSGQAVPVGAFMNLLGTLANQAATDADQLMGESGSAPSYLLDSEGHFRSDPLVPENRAHLLYQTLAAAEEERLLESGEAY